MTHGVIATPRRLATEAGAQVLREGGNAVDAAIAANAVLCVVYPHMTSVGGDLMAIVWPAGAVRPEGLIGCGRSGSLATLTSVRDRGHQAMPQRGVLTVTVQGTVEAWGRLLERFGSWGLAPVLEPAAAIAEAGYEVTASLAGYLERGAGWLAEEPETARLFPTVAAGSRLRNPDLAAALRAIGRGGFQVFYRGELAPALAAAIAKRDGLVTAADLGRQRSEWRKPIGFDYRGVTVYNLPPPKQGLVALGLLASLQPLSVHELEPGPGLAGHLRRARDRCYGLRDRLITDPDFSPAPAEPFLDPDHDSGGGEGAIPEGDTIYLCAADELGNVVSLIQSVANDFGSGIVAEGTGILLQNRGCYFSLDPDHVNRLEPNKRTMHTLIPALAVRDGRPWAAFGSMGADGQPQIQAQLATALIDRGLDPAEAVAAPRIRVQAGGAVISVEEDYPGAGHLGCGLPEEILPRHHRFFGHAQALVVDGPRAWRAGADPRSDGSAAIV